jgi:diguanylate cyclase (GGDEF)-like protein
VLWMLAPGNDELYPARSTGLDSMDLGAVKLGRGVAGLAADRSTTLVLPDDSGPRPAPGEPQLPVTIAVPIFSKERMRGVVSVYRRDADRPFSKDDVETVQFLAQQSGVAVENVLLHEEAQRLSITDGLTGVWNRRYFSIQFRQVLATSKRFERQFSLLMIDLDHFKAVNDEHGHQRGDAVLTELTQRAQRALREVDTIARYGGEEFVVLLTETDVVGGETTARKILDAIRNEPFTVSGDHSLKITASIGVASFPRHGTTLTSLVDAADRALYKAKSLGRDRVVVAGDDRPPGLRLAQ